MGFEPNPKTKEIDAAILENERLVPAFRLKAAELAVKLETTKEHIYNRMTRLRNSGVIEPRGTLVRTAPLQKSTQQALEAPQIKTYAIDATELLARVMAGEIVDAQERKKQLSIVIASGEDAQKLTAIRLLEDIESGHTVGIGPPEPEEQYETEELSRMMTAVGQEKTDAAYKLAFGGADGTNPQADQASQTH